MKAPLKILGLDPGLQKTGWGIVVQDGSAIRYIASGQIKTNPKDTLPERLVALHDGIKSVIETHAPDIAGVEETFVNKNPASALKLGQARGIILATPQIMDVPTFEYSANKVKKSVVGVGHADKKQVQMMIRTLLPASGTVSEDESDALAVAITCAHYREHEKNTLDALMKSA